MIFGRRDSENVIELHGGFMMCVCSWGWSRHGTGWMAVEGLTQMFATCRRKYLPGANNEQTTMLSPLTLTLSEQLPNVSLLIKRGSINYNAIQARRPPRQTSCLTCSWFFLFTHKLCVLANDNAQTIRYLINP